MSESTLQKSNEEVQAMSFGRSFLVGVAVGLVMFCCGIFIGYSVGRAATSSPAPTVIQQPVVTDTVKSPLTAPS